MATSSGDTSSEVWKGGEVKAFLLDINGVLYNCDSDGGCAIPGSVDAVKRLKAAGIPVRFVTNETSCTRRHLVYKLHKLGFDLAEAEVFPPAPAVIRLLKQRSLRPYLLVDDEARPDYDEVDQTNPNCLVIADAGEQFSYQNMNKAFQTLMSLKEPKIFSLGMGRYYRNQDSLHLDVGCFTKALEVRRYYQNLQDRLHLDYAVGTEAEVVGKPTRSFFQSALSDLGLPAHKVVMVGDDVVGDVGGAQAAGMYGVLVRTGKFRAEDEHHPTVKPDDVVDNLSHAVDKYLLENSRR